MGKQKSILEMARGAFLERADYEMSHIMDNILDANTKATAKRKMTLTVEFVPDDDRTNISVSFNVKSTLAPTNPAKTNLYVCGDNSTGEQAVVEMVPEVPGQYSIDGDEQEAPSSLRVVKFG